MNPQAITQLLSVTPPQLQLSPVVSNLGLVAYKDADRAAFGLAQLGYFSQCQRKQNLGGPSVKVYPATLNKQKSLPYIV